MMKSPPSIVEVLEKAVRVLEILAVYPQGATLQRITDETGLPKSSVHRLLTTWERLRYVTRLGGGNYQLGFAALELARKVGGRNRLTELSQSVLRRLQSLTGESVYLGVYRKGRVILVNAIESSHPLRVVIDFGEQCHLHASAQGRCVAAWLEPERLHELLHQHGTPKVTAKTDISPAVLARRLEEVRERGYSINWEETVEGSVCLGAPFFAGPGGGVLGSVGVSIPTPRAVGEHVNRCLEALLAAVRDLTQVLTEILPEPDVLQPGPAVTPVMATPLTAHAPSAGRRKPIQ